MICLPKTRSNAGVGIRIILRVLLGVLLLLASRGDTVHGCGGCFQLPYQSLLEKVNRADRAVVAHATDRAGVSWVIDRAIKGREPQSGETIQVDQLAPQAKANFHGPHILHWNQVLDSWTIEGAADAETIAFLTSAMALSTYKSTVVSSRELSKDLQYFLPHLEHGNPQIADSAYKAIADAPFAAIRRLREHLDAAQLLKFIENPQLNSKRRALYIILLGCCGGQRETELLKQWADQRWESHNAGDLAAILAAHIELNGEEAIRFIERSYLQDRDRKLDELIAAVDALRMHGEADGKISRTRILSSFQLFLRERPPLLELVIEDCARWKDWSIAPKLMEIYAGGQQPWNNALIIKYLEACPLPDAKHFVAKAIALNPLP